MQNKRQGIISQIVQEIVLLSNPTRVLLFGSAAKGKNHAGDDLDFLIIVKDRQDPNRVLDQLNMGVKTRSLPCDFLVATEKTIKKHGRTPGLIYREALSEGVVLYAA